MDAWLNDPATVKAGLLENAKKAVSDYETSLIYSGPDGDKMLKGDKLLNQQLQKYGFEREDGMLRYNPSGEKRSVVPEQQQAPAEAPPAPEDVVAPTNIPVQPIEYQAGKPVYDATALNPDQAKQLKSGTLLRVPDGQGGFKYKRIP